MTLTLADVQAKHSRYFSRETQILFGDIKYWVLHDKDHNPYLVRYTTAWTDMFDDIKKPHYKVNPLTPSGDIGQLFEEEFLTLQDVKTWLRK